jgi:hypothetical protein
VIEDSTSLHLARDCSGRSAKMQKEIHLRAESKPSFDASKPVGKREDLVRKQADSRRQARNHL